MCTLDKRGNIFILTLTSTNEKEDEHRLNPTLITTLRSTIADIKSQALSSPNTPFILITTSTGKFFSNGFDLKWAQSFGPSSFTARLHEMVELFKPLMADIISLPMPTIAAVNGHAAAAGFMLALSHDYLFMKKERCVLYMSEVDIGMTFPEYFNVLFREKLGSKARREVMMRGVKVRGGDGVKLGVVDDVFDDVFENAVKFGEGLVKRRFDGQIFAEIRKGLYPDLSDHLGLVRKSLLRPRL